MGAHTPTALPIRCVRRSASRQGCSSHDLLLMGASRLWKWERMNGEGQEGREDPFQKSAEDTNRRQTLIARKSDQHGGGHEKLLGQVSGLSTFIKWKHPLVFAASMAFPFLGHVLLASPPPKLQPKSQLCRSSRGWCMQMRYLLGKDKLKPVKVFTKVKSFLK